MSIKNLFIAAIGLMVFTSCENSYTIHDLFEMDGCNGPCYQQMPCEGQQVTVKVHLDGNNTMRNGHMYFVRAVDDFQRTIKVEFDESVPEETQSLLQSTVNKTAVIKGRLEGYDLLNPNSCRRAHIVYVKNAADITFE